MVEATSLVDAHELQFFDGVGDLVQVLLGKMQIPGRGLQILMAEQKLDGAQVGAGLQQVRGPAVAHQVRAGGLTNTSFFPGLGACLPYCLVAGRLLRAAMHA